VLALETTADPAEWISPEDWISDSAVDSGAAGAGGLTSGDCSIAGILLLKSPRIACTADEIDPGDSGPESLEVIVAEEESAAGG
jgi:hypothetical protein